MHVVEAQIRGILRTRIGVILCFSTLLDELAAGYATNLLFPFKDVPLSLLPFSEVTMHS